MLPMHRTAAATARFALSGGSDTSIFVCMRPSFFSLTWQGRSTSLPYMLLRTWMAYLTFLTLLTFL